MKILTGNDLESGDVIWWTGSDWSLHVDDAVDAGEHAEAILAAEEAARRVNASYVDRRHRDGRAACGPPTSRNASARSGPTVRPDLTLKPADPAAGNWVI